MQKIAKLQRSSSDKAGNRPFFNTQNSQYRTDTKFFSKSKQEDVTPQPLKQRQGGSSDKTTISLTRPAPQKDEQEVPKDSSPEEILRQPAELAGGALPPPEDKSKPQAPLIVGAPNSPEEGEADRFADRVAAMPESKTSSRKEPIVKGTPANHAGAIMARSEGDLGISKSLTAKMLHAPKTSPAPLPQPLATKLEAASGHDLSQVRIHTDDSAHHISQSLNAKAFTYGRDIYFKQGQYQPHTQSGQHLLAHEVGHVVGGHSGVRRNIDDYDVVPLGDFPNLWELARYYHLKPRDVLELNKKAYKEEYDREFKPRRLFPNSRIFLPKGTIKFHSNQEAMEVELRKESLGNKHFDDPLYPGTLREYELRYFVREYDDYTTNRTSFALAISQKLDILLDAGTQFTVKIVAETGLDTFDAEREHMNRKQLEAYWLKQSIRTGGLDIYIRSETFNQDTVALTHYETGVNAFAPGSKGVSIQQEQAGAGATFGNLNSSLEEKYRAAIQLTRSKIDFSSYSMIDFNRRLDGDTYYTLRAADTAFFKLREWPGDAVISETRQGLYRVVPLTQADMSFIAEYQRTGDNPQVTSQRLWWVKEDKRIVRIMYDGYIDQYQSNLENLFFRTQKQAWQHAETKSGRYSAVFFTHSNGFHGWAMQPGTEIDAILDHAVKTLPPGATFDGFFKATLTNNLGKTTLPIKAWGLRSGQQLHRIDQEYFEGRDVWLANEDIFNVEQRSNPITTFINSHPVAGHKLHRYLQVELDRNRDITKNLGATIQGSYKEQLAKNLQSYSISQIWFWAKNKALEIVKTSVDRLTTLRNDRDALQAYLLGYLQLKTDGQKHLFLEALGLNDQQMSKATAVFSNKQKFFQVLLGNTADGISMEWFQEIIGGTFSELAGLNWDIRSEKIVPLELEGGFGDSIREAVYKQFGFDLKPGAYPHEEEAKFGEGYRPGKGYSKYRTLREQQWIEYSAAKARRKRQSDYLITALKVVAAVTIIIVSGGIGSGVAAAFFAEGSAAFVATEIIVGAVAYTILQEGFDQLIGEGRLGAEKDHYGLASFGGAFLYNLIFFGIFRGLGEVLKSSGQIARIAGTTSAFLAVEFISYIMAHGEVPKGHDLNLLLFRTFLTVALLEGGSVLARPYTRAMIKGGKTQRFNRFLDKIDALHAETIKAQEQLSEVLAKPKRTSKEQFDLLDQQLRLLERRGKVLAEIKNDTEVSVKDRSDVDITMEISRISEVTKLMKEARFQAEVGVQQLEFGGALYTYRRGPSDMTGTDAMAAFEAYYGKGNVSIDPNGIITVKIGVAELVFFPENTGLAGSTLGTELSSAAYAGTVRNVDEGVVIFEPVQANRFANLFKNKGGTWKEIDPNTFVAELGGRQTIFISEFHFNMAETALNAEAIKTGSGMQVLRIGLRSEQAMKGLEAWEHYEMGGNSNKAKLEKLKEMEEAGRSGKRRESLQSILEGKFEQYQLLEETAALGKKLRSGKFHYLQEVRKAMRMNEAEKTKAEGIIQAEIVEFLATQQLATAGEKQFTSVEPARLVEGFESITDYRTKGDGAIKWQKLREFKDSTSGDVTVWESLGEVDVLQTNAANKPLRGYEVKAGKGGSSITAREQLQEAFNNLQQVHADGSTGNKTFRVFERGAKATYEHDLTGVLDLSTASSTSVKSVGITHTADPTKGYDVTIKMTEEPLTSGSFSMKNRLVLEQTAREVFEHRAELLPEGDIPGAGVKE